MKTVILAAGFGSRLWPLSTESAPKQFQTLREEGSLLQYTHKLFEKIAADNELFILTLEGLEHYIYEQIPGFSPDNVILIPKRLNTLPNSFFALSKLTSDPEEPILFSSVDNFFPESAFLSDALQKFIRAVEGDEFNLLESIAIFGSSSRDYASGYGYIITDETLQVRGFIEKPTLAAYNKAKSAGKLYKSCFIFSGTKISFLLALKKYAPELYEKSARLINANDANRIANFINMPELDLSKSLFQKTKSLVIQPIEGEYVDLGRFINLFNISSHDDEGNRIIGKVIIDGKSSNNLIINQLKQPLVVRHMKDSVIIQAESGTLVSPLKDVDSIGTLYKSNLDYLRH